MGKDDGGVRERAREDETPDAAQRALERSEALNRTLIASITQKLFLKDRNSVYVAVNERYAQSLGFEPKHVVGKDDFAFFPTELAEKYRADDLAVMESGRAADVDERYVAQGMESWVRTIKTPLRNDAGEVTGVLGLFEDITERKRAAQVLEASERRYRRLFEAAKDGILILNAQTGEIVDVNPFLVQLTGYSHEELLGRQLWEIGAFKDIAASRDSFATLQSDKYVRYENLPLRARDGRRVEVEFVSNVYRVDDENVIQCNIRDITERNRTETERVRLTAAIEQAGEIVLITDTKGDIVYANPVFETVTGYSRAEVLGRNPRLLKSGVQDEAFYRTLWTTISSGKTWHGRLVNKKKDGTIYTEDATISPVRDASGTITSYVSVKRDITPVLALQAQFLQAQKMESIGRLAGGVAHDFNNLLSVILSYTGFALDQLREGEPLREDLEEVQKAGERAAALTRQLLAFSRRQALQPKSLDLNQVLADMERMLCRLIGEDIDLVRVASPDLGLVNADPSQVEQVLMNLVINARDAMPTGGRLTIETANAELDEGYAARHAAVEPGSYVMLAVSDTGVGMDPQTRDIIFDPFFTTKEKGKGTGLGLSTVYGIVKQSRGNIWVYSELGKGTTFKVYLPRALEASTPTDIRRTTGPVRFAGTETLLFVDDEDALRKVGKRALEGAGYTVLTAANGEEALLIAGGYQGDIHLLVTDVVMPRMGGSALAQKLLKTGRTLQVLYMSGYTDDAIVRQGVLDFGTRFLSKPFTAAALARSVREALDVAE